mgnify:CR=1 FL=1
MTTSSLGPTEEREWQEKMLKVAERMLLNCVWDRLISEEHSALRVTTFTESDYHAILGDRKLLVDYLEHPDFPEGGRPVLSFITEVD